MLLCRGCAVLRTPAGRKKEGKGGKMSGPAGMGCQNGVSEGGWNMVWKSSSNTVNGENTCPVDRSVLWSLPMLL